MAETVMSAELPVSPPANQPSWSELRLELEQLEARYQALEHDHKALRQLLERVIEHRQKSHNELVLILAGLVSKLPLNEVGVIVSRLVEHNTQVSQFLGALGKGTVDTAMPEPAILRTLDHAKHDLTAALKPVVEELLQLDTPLETDLLQGIAKDTEVFYSPRMVRGHRCFVKGLLPRERILREFGPEALVLFNDLTTDPKLNPRPKADEIVMGFKTEFEALCQQQPGLLPAKREALMALYQRVQRSKAPTEQARAQKNAFQRLAFLVELLHYYEHPNTEAPDVVFAQRLPALVEQLVLAGHENSLDAKLLLLVESLMAFVINPDHRQMIVNNVGKGDGPARTLRYVLRLRAEKVAEIEVTCAEFARHLIVTSPQKPPEAASLAAMLRLLIVERQAAVVRAIMACDRLRKKEAETLGRAIADLLGLKKLDEVPKHLALTPEAERQAAWVRIKELLVNHADASAVAAAIRERLHARYDADEIRQSWLTLTEIDPLSFIRVFCHLPYLANGTTDPIARTIMETYVSRLTHEKYGGFYQKVVKSLRNMFRVKADSPTLLNFTALVRWTNPEAADKILLDIGMLPAASH